jgi:hypothetical protein
VWQDKQVTHAKEAQPPQVEGSIFSHTSDTFERDQKTSYAFLIPQIQYLADLKPNVRDYERNPQERKEEGK